MSLSKNYCVWMQSMISLDFYTKGALFYDSSITNFISLMFFINSVLFRGIDFWWERWYTPGEITYLPVIESNVCLSYVGSFFWIELYSEFELMLSFVSWLFRMSKMIGLLSEFKLYILLAAFLLFFPWNDIILKLYQPFYW